MSRVYGPVPSRRLGQSLGVDPIPFKTCNYSCVYCQLGRTTPFTTEWRDFFPPEDILEELRDALARSGPGEIDYITFVGQGEPLLCASLGKLIRGVKSLTPLPVAVITNGSLLFLPEIRAELSAADVVIPTLDAADEVTFRRINRPWPKLRIADITSGLRTFREEYDGQLWIEVMLVRGVNDTEPVLLKLAHALRRIRPDQIHLNVPIRPPAEEWVEVPDAEGLERATSILGEIALIVRPAEGDFGLSSESAVVDAVIEVLRRHPMAHREVVRTLERVAPGKVAEAITALGCSDQVARRVHTGQTFWTFTGGRYAEVPAEIDRERDQEAPGRRPRAAAPLRIEDSRSHHN